MITMINEIKDALKRDSSTVFSFNLTPSIGAGIAASAPPQMPDKRGEIVASVIERQSKTGEENKLHKSTEQPHNDNSAQEKTPPEVQTSNSTLPQQRELSSEFKAATSWLNAENGYIAAVEKHQENTLKHYDKLRIQQIQNELSYRKPIPITNNVSVKVEPPLDAFPTPWQSFINSTSCSLNVPEAALISGLLAAVFTSVCGKFKIKVRNNYFEACTEYFIVVMPSGSKKSAVVQTCRSPLDRYIEKIQAEFDKKAPNKKRIMQLYKIFEKNLLTTCANEVEGKDIPEIDFRINDIEMKLHPLKMKLREVASRPILFNDFPTMKKLAENMQDQNEFIAIFDAEPGIWKYRVRANEDMILLKGYTMESFGNETATNGSVTMRSPCIAICSYIQPGVAFQLYSKEDLKDDGLLPRILPIFCLSKLAIQNTIPQDINPELMAMYENKISSILEYCWEERSYTREIEILKMTDGALQEYLYFSQKVSLQTHEWRFENCKAFASKLAGHAVRLAGAVHFLEHDKPWEKPIGSSAMRAGIALAEFYAEHAIFAFDKKQNDSFVYARKILKWIKRQRVANFEQRGAQRGVGHCKNDQIEAGIDLLLKNNHLAQHLNYKGRMIYVVNPHAYKDEENI